MRLDNITVTYGNKVVLDRLSWTAPQTGLVWLDAPSGGGKTTLFRAIAGLVPLADGRVEAPERISYAFQEPRLLPWYSAWENVAIVCPDKAPAEAKARLLRFGFTESELDLRPTQLSGGMRQRVNLARAFHYDGDLFLLDEPFTGLDAENVARVSDAVRAMASRRLVLLVDHGSALAPDVDQVLKLANGSVRIDNKTPKFPR